MDENIRETNPLLNNEALRQNMLERQREDRRRGMSFAFGIIVVIFSVIGFVGCIFLAISHFGEIKASKEASRYASYNEFFVPLAAVDPSTFDDITAAPMEELIEISVWSIIGSDLDPEQYDYSSGELKIPASEIEAQYAKFFGSELPVVHCTVTGYGYEFSYSEDDNAYYIPLTTIEPLYTPDVTAIETRGDTEIVTLGLINVNSWAQDAKTGDLMKPEADKYLKITLRKYGGSTYIGAIQSTARPESAVVK